MPVIDSQVHVWGPDTRESPWVPGMAHRVHLPEPLLPEKLLAGMDAAGVDGAVLVPPSLWTGYSNELALRAAEEYPHRFAVMGVLDAVATESRGAIGSWLEHPGMKGLRLTFYNEPQRTQLVDGLVDWLWPMLSERNIPVAVNAPGLLEHFRRTAERWPQLRLAIDHLGLHAGDQDQPIVPRLEPLLALAQFPNVVAKASGLPLQSHEPYPFKDLHEPISMVVDSFGPERVLWGTDLSRLSCSYSEAVKSMTTALQGYGEGVVSAVMGRSAARWLGFTAVGNGGGGDRE